MRCYEGGRSRRTSSLTAGRCPSSRIPRGTRVWAASSSPLRPGLPSGGATRSPRISRASLRAMVGGGPPDGVRRTGCWSRDAGRGRAQVPLPTGRCGGNPAARTLPGRSGRGYHRGQHWAVETGAVQGIDGAKRPADDVRGDQPEADGPTGARRLAPWQTPSTSRPATRARGSLRRPAARSAGTSCRRGQLDAMRAMVYGLPEVDRWPSAGPGGTRAQVRHVDGGGRTMRLAIGRKPRTACWRAADGVATKRAGTATR